MNNTFEAVLNRAVVSLNLKAADMHGAIIELVAALAARGQILPQQVEPVTQAVLKREMSASTVMADGIALPHGRLDTISQLICAIGISAGFNGNAPDGKPVRIILLLLVPTQVGCNHIHFLARISQKLLDPITHEKLVTATAPEEVLKTLLPA